MTLQIFKPRSIVDRVRRIIALSKLGHSFAAMPSSKDAVFCIVMPGGAHLGLLAVQLASRGGTVILIGNGISKAEASWLRRQLPSITFVITAVPLRHYQILNKLFMTRTDNFAIIDYDCFVIDPEILRELTKTSDVEICSSVYSENFNRRNLAMPETFLVHFNVDAVRKIMTDYNVGTQGYRSHELPPKARDKMKEFEFNDNGYIDDRKPDFDTLRVVFLLGHLTGKSYRLTRNYESFHGDASEVFHVGSVSNPHLFRSPYSYWGSYFWMKTLRAFDDDDFNEIAFAQFGADVFDRIERAFDEYSSHMFPDLPELTDSFCKRITKTGIEDHADGAVRED